MTARLPRLGPDERQLIVDCARRELDDRVRDHAEALLRGHLDWDAIVLFAESHSVAPLLHHHVTRLNGAALIPPEARRRLLRIVHRTEYRNRQYSSALHDLLAAFAGDGIPVVVLKGLALVELVYGHLGLRPLIDLNLLIPRDRLEMASAILLEMGYVQSAASRSALYRWLNSQLFFVGPGRFAVHLLLQWGVVNGPRIHAIDLRRFWAEARPARLAGRDTLIPSPVDTVLYLSLQANKWGYLNGSVVHAADPSRFIFEEWTHNRLIRFTDVHEVVRRYGSVVDWDALIARAKASGIEGSVYGTAYWISRLFGSAIPPRLFEALHPPSPRRVRRWLFRVVAEGGTAGRTESAVIARIRTWWSTQRHHSQLRLTRLVDRLEYVFPRRTEFRLRRGLDVDGRTSHVYAFHVAQGFMLCALGFVSWSYRVLESRLRRRLRSLVPPRPTPRRIPSTLGSDRR